MPSFLHHGKMGDIIYSLPTVKALGGGDYYLRHKEDNSDEASINRFSALQMCRLLETQHYIKDALLYYNQRIDYDFGDFRKDLSPFTQLTDAHARLFGVNIAPDEPWMEVDALQVAPIVVGRSCRHHGSLDWHQLDHHKSDCVFIGTRDEHDWFKLVLDIPYYPCDDIPTLARVIAGCKMFVGNQSFFWSLAEAMKVNRVMEVYRPAPNCLPYSLNGMLSIQHMLRRLDMTVVE